MTPEQVNFIAESIRTSGSPAMFSDEGNKLARDIMHGTLIWVTEFVKHQPGQPSRADIIAHVNAGAQRVAAAGHREVNDTEPEWWLVDRTNEILDALGYKPWSRFEEGFTDAEPTT